MKKNLPGKRRPVTAHVAKAPAKPLVSFVDLLMPMISLPGKAGGRGESMSSPLARLDYGEELRIKNQALAEFWQKNNLPGQPTPVIGSPKARGYRTTSQRRAVFQDGILHLVFGDTTTVDRRHPLQHSALEPVEHGAIYAFLQKKLSEPPFRLVAAHLNYLIIRGSYQERVVIFNVDQMSGPLIRKLKIVADHLQRIDDPIMAAHVYFDPSRSKYYLESRRPVAAMGFKTLFGPVELTVTVADCRFKFHPTSFSQVNEAMVPVLLKQARQLLAPSGGSLLDLYCGYGLFSHFLAPDYTEVVAVDSEGPSIKAARENIRLNAGRGGSIKFSPLRITGDSLDKMFATTPFPDTVLLDPPRQGPQDKVITSICGHRPKRVLHVFCGVDQITTSLKKWRSHGYWIKKIVPLDLFPGSTNLEVMILLGPR
ncbi:MAG: methyltransferase [Proteobacteria bacterium]|nr:methyltransferase [Pseudomonadota bacterium]MBU1686960.1 methyltransferase [Pseudomonadota bacterium]